VACSSFIFLKSFDYISANFLINIGKVVEYDSPVKLLKDNSSSFSKLVMEFLRRSIQE
jgi:hypothetical protein